MNRRILWTAVLLALVAGGLVVAQYLIVITRASLDAGFAIGLSTLSWVAAVGCLLPLAARWGVGSPRQVQLLRTAARTLGIMGLVLGGVALWLHLRLDHRPGGGGRYPEWDLGVWVFLVDHRYFVYNALASLVVLWLAGRHRAWATVRPGSPGSQSA